MGWLGKRKIRLFQEQRGIGLMETLVALALLGLIGVVFLNGLSTSSKAVIVNQENVAAESLASSQVEKIKNHKYISLDDYDPTESIEGKYYPKIPIPADLASQGYSIEIKAPEPIISDNTTPPALGPFELQSIEVVVKHNGQGVLTISVYKCGSS